ncbi:hypothetical protein ALTER154_80574 [Alteromonas sp. 154]|nr:hypothetical protein ALTER154_80574 [Alteromonas sp. 154]
MAKASCPLSFSSFPFSLFAKKEYENARYYYYFLRVARGAFSLCISRSVSLFLACSLNLALLI